VDADRRLIRDWSRHVGWFVLIGDQAKKRHRECNRGICGGRMTLESAVAAARVIEVRQWYTIVAVECYSQFWDS
jgi:hypothetical protein